MRTEECCGLKWNRIDWESNEIIVDNAYKDFKRYNEDGTKVVGHYRADAKLKTPQSYRRIPLNPRLRERLLEHKKYQQELFKKSRAIKDRHRKWTEEEYVFLGRNYHPYVSQSLGNGMREFRKKYQLKSQVSPYRTSTFICNILFRKWHGTTCLDETYGTY